MKCFRRVVHCMHESVGDWGPPLSPSLPEGPHPMAETQRVSPKALGIWGGVEMAVLEVHQG